MSASRWASRSRLLCPAPKSSMAILTPALRNTARCRSAIICPAGFAPCSHISNTNPRRSAGLFARAPSDSICKGLTLQCFYSVIKMHVDRINRSNGPEQILSLLNELIHIRGLPLKDRIRIEVVVNGNNRAVAKLPAQQALRSGYALGFHIEDRLHSVSDLTRQDRRTDLASGYFRLGCLSCERRDNSRGTLHVAYIRYGLSRLKNYCNAFSLPLRLPQSNIRLGDSDADKSRSRTRLLVRYWTKFVNHLSRRPVSLDVRTF